MGKRKLRMILLIGPWGFHGHSISVYFTDKKENLLEYTRGEGQAFRFVLEDADLGQRFSEALDRGLFLEDAKRGIWRLNFRYYDEIKPGELLNETMRGIEQLDTDLDQALEAGDLIVKQAGIVTEISQRGLSEEDWSQVEAGIKRHKTPLEEDD